MSQRKRRETTSRQLMRISRIGSVVVPAVVLLYLVLAYSQAGIAVRTDDQPLVLIAALAWLVVGFMLTQEKTTYRFQSTRWLGAYHIDTGTLFAVCCRLCEPADVPLVNLTHYQSYIYLGCVAHPELERFC